jgi:hypothetical protein
MRGYPTLDSDALIAAYASAVIEIAITTRA